MKLTYANQMLVHQLAQDAHIEAVYAAAATHKPDTSSNDLHWLKEMHVPFIHTVCQQLATLFTSKL